MRLALVLCLAALCGSVAAGRPDLFDVSGDAGRGLLQQGSECSSIDHCTTCRFQFVRGTVTRAVCTACLNGYVPKALGAFCWCAPGYYWKASTSTCETCTNNYFCPGSKSTPTSASQTSCGTNKNTQTDLAKSERECLANPGCGWASGDATACDPGTYNPGYNNRKCSRCPGGLTTVNGSSTDPSACLAPAGFYYLRGKAVACAQGSYKTGIANADCLECNEGITTEPGKTAKTALADCNYLKAGYSVADPYVAGTTNGTLCEAGTYRAGDVNITGAINCTSCGNSLTTPPEVTGATSADECMAPPGYEYYLEVLVPKARECGVGFYKGGYNREACSSCPSGFTTGAVTTATSVDECYVPAGFGTSFDGTTWSAEACPVNSYGRDSPSYGLVDVPCVTCIEGTNTDGKDTQTSPSACVLNAGWGYYNGEARRCDVGYWNAGNNTAPCTKCGAGLTTSLEGSTASTDCLVAPGYYGDSSTGSAKPCPKGTYQSTTAANVGSCTPCSTGLTTSLSEAATSSADCDLCTAGYGGSSCTKCLVDTFSAGATKNDCTACSAVSVTKPAGYNGELVAREGATSSSQCVREFSSDSATATTNLPWDYLATDTGVLTDRSDANATMAACQDACNLSNQCIYFEYRSTSPATCGLLLTPLNVTAKPTFSATSTTNDPWLVLDVGDGLHTVNKMGSAPAANIGTTIVDTHANFTVALAACKTDAACAGFNMINATNWRTFRGTKWGNTIGKLRTIGYAINAWLP